MKLPERFFSFLASRELAVSLFLLLCMVLVPQTFGKKQDIELNSAGVIVLGATGLNLLLCTVKRLKTLPRSVMVLHAGTVLILAGAVVSSFGYVATVNVYEGTSVDRAYRWDMKKDMPLGADLALKKIRLEYYPVPVKVGVLRGDEKFGLFELKTGERFTLGRYTVSADSLELPGQNLRLSVHADQRYIGVVDTEGLRNIPPDFPYDFRLVAYKNPHVKKALVELQILKESRVVAEGISEVNSPLTWGKLSFYNTAVESDRFGNRFAGIQITYDPGRPYVYLGFIVTGAGSLLYLARRFRGHR